MIIEWNVIIYIFYIYIYKWIQMHFFSKIKKNFKKNFWKYEDVFSKINILFYWDIRI